MYKERRYSKLFNVSFRRKILAMGTKLVWSYILFTETLRKRDTWLQVLHKQSCLSRFINQTSY